MPWVKLVAVIFPNKYVALFPYLATEIMYHNCQDMISYTAKKSSKRIWWIECTKTSNATLQEGVANPE